MASEALTRSVLALALACVACGPEGIGMDEMGEAPESIVEDPEQEIEGAIDDLEIIVQGVVDDYLVGVEPEWAEGTVHLCPHPIGSPSAGHAGLTPGEDVDCNAREDGLCVPEEGGEGPGIYDTIFYTMNSVWVGAGFEKSEPHAFRYDLFVLNEQLDQDYANCRFTAAAYADLDDDGIFSTYERRGELSESGVLIDPMLYVTEE